MPPLTEPNLCWGSYVVSDHLKRMKKTCQRPSPQVSNILINTSLFHTEIQGQNTEGRVVEGWVGQKM